MLPQSTSTQISFYRLGAHLIHFRRYDITTSDITFSILPTPLKFIHPKANSLPSARVHFVAVLEPPVYVSDSVARALGNLAAITSRGEYNVCFNHVD